MARARAVLSWMAVGLLVIALAGMTLAYIGALGSPHGKEFRSEAHCVEAYARFLASPKSKIDLLGKSVRMYEFGVGGKPYIHAISFFNFIADEIVGESALFITHGAMSCLVDIEHSPELQERAYALAALLAGE